MNYVCQVCGDSCDEFGNRTDQHEEQSTPTKAITCIPCRLEAIRCKQFGKRIERDSSLPYKD